MKKLSGDFDEMVKTIVTTFEDLDLNEVFELIRVMTKRTDLCSRPFVKNHHSYQMRRSVYDMGYEVAYYIIERVWKDDGQIMVTFIERTEGGEYCEPETIEWTLEIDAFLHMIVGMAPFYHWE